ncbi:N-succinylarginine dihydrolase [Motiliproteus sp. MSK22-1]|uniref:N-succinylarginine dihydrolase n=1 Tax=Motiliproteus sp. MSK22-1 TaxID=1897630 RepID=UPI0009766F56|nr:N-succinylarginine dihydrolase [Motiliproteus sp. MSK22-1]OMH30084.1 N-succinylarginine dihydrolase [Motiliproteus sp. MSK22-1]
MRAFEANFDGLVGPTHNYSGLSFGNIASSRNQAATSNPKLAAKQGLAKMKKLADLGLVQGVLAPQERPDIHTLRRLGFSGSDAQVLAQAAQQMPRVLAACCSASSMWTANAATVSPSADTLDRRVHFTPANLTNKFHRSIEHDVTGRILKASFPDHRYFVHHQALPGVEHFGDEGAANHTRFCKDYGDFGIEMFVFGRYAFDDSKPKPIKFPARHTFEASESIARSHRLNSQDVIYAQQNPDVIDQGVFHNDVIGVGNRNLLFCHEQAYLNKDKLYNDLKRAFDGDFHVVEVASDRLSVNDVVGSYLFNSQLLNITDDHMTLLVPEECQQNSAVRSYLEEVVATDNPIGGFEVMDLKQSMRNGGGPACLRLRIVLTEEELKAVNPSTLINDQLYQQLDQWIEKHYRDQLSENDLADPQLLMESRSALDELTQILQLGTVYPFQR